MGFIDWLRGRPNRTQLEHFLLPLSIDSIGSYFDSHFDASGLMHSTALLILHQSKLFLDELVDAGLVGYASNLVHPNVAVFEAAVFLASISIGPSLDFAQQDLGLGLTVPVTSLDQVKSLDGVIDPLCDALLHTRGAAVSLILNQWPGVSQDHLAKAVSLRNYKCSPDATADLVSWLISDEGRETPSLDESPESPPDVRRLPLNIAAIRLATRIAPALISTMQRKIQVLHWHRSQSAKPGS